MSISRSLRRAVPACTLAAVTLLIGPAAFADQPLPGSGTGSTTPPTTDRPAQETHWRNCTIVSGPTYIGGVCAGERNKGRTVKQILGDDPVPDCWDDKATDAELASLLPARAPVEKEHIETEMRTASGIVNAKGRYIAGVVLLTAGYSADGKYSHYLIVQAPVTIGGVALKPGEYVFGWDRAKSGDSKSER